MRKVSVIIHGSTARLSGANASVLEECLAFDDPDRGNNKAFIQGRWDGKVRLYECNEFPAGLTQRVIAHLQERGYRTSIIEPEEDVPTLDFERLTPEYLPGISMTGDWAHQYDALMALMHAKRGCIKVPTGGGKTEIFCAGARFLWEEYGWRSLLLTSRRDLISQTVERANKYFDSDIRVGQAGDGVKDVEDCPVVIASAQTLLGYKPRERKVRKSKAHPYGYTKHVPADAALRALIRDYEVLWLDECLDPDTRISTPCGTVRLGSLRAGDEVLTPTGETARVKRVWTTRKRAYRYIFSGGCELIASPNHLVVDGSYRNCEVKPLRDVHSMLLNRATLLEVPRNDLFEYILGWFYGDGTCTRSQRQKASTIKFSFRKDLDAIRGIFMEEFAGWFRELPPNARGDATFVLQPSYTAAFVSAYGIRPGPKTNTVEIAESVFEKRSVSVVRGLFDAEGSRTDGRISLDMTSHRCVEQIAEILGHHGVACTLKPLRKPKNPKHKRKYRVSIYGDAINRFNAVFGFRICRKQRNNLGREWAQRHAKVDLLRVEASGVRDLIDIELDNEDRLFIANDLIVHNCHHASADSWYEIAKFSNAKRRFGMSGTPLKDEALSDAKLEGATGPLLFSVDTEELIETGTVARPKIVMVMCDNASGPELPEVWYVVENPRTGEQIRKKGRKRYRDAYVEGIVENVHHNAAVIRAVAWLADHGRKVLLVTRRKAHYTTLHDMLEAQGISFVHAWGDTETPERKRAKVDFMEGGADVLLATTIFDEGTDVPGIDALVLAEGVKVNTNVLQRIGRGMRRKDGANDVLVVDFVVLCHPTLADHGLQRCETYENEGYEVVVVEDWPSKDDEDFDGELLPFVDW